MQDEEFDSRFDQGEDITTTLELTEARHPGHEQRGVNADFPSWMYRLPGS